MKSVSRRLKGFLTALMYVALYYAVSFVVYNGYALWLAAVGRLSYIDTEKTVINNSYILTLVSWGVCYWLYVLVGKIRKIPLIKAIGKKKNPPIIYAMASVLAIGCRLLVVVYYSIAQKVGVLEQSIENATAASPEITTTAQLLIALCCTVIIAPFFEELLFRVLVMGELMKIMRPWAAITIQAIAFGAVHGVLFQSIFAGAVGIVLGIVYYKTQNIKVAATCHSVFNFSAVLTQENLALSGTLVFVIAGILLSSLSLFYIINNSREDN